MDKTRKRNKKESGMKKGKSRKHGKYKTAKKAKTKKCVFTAKEYSSGDGMLTSVWGPSMWHYLHTMSFNYPNKPTSADKKHYRDFILNLQYVLPCKYCRTNLTNNLSHYPLEDCHLKNRRAFSYYVYRLHEIVNKMLKKPSNLSYRDVRERYEHFRSRCTEEKGKIFKFRKTKKEKGCTEPLYGKKAKAVIKIVPKETRCKTLQIDKKCIKSKEK